MLLLATVHLTAVVVLLLNVCCSSAEVCKASRIHRKQIQDVQLTSVLYRRQVCGEMKEKRLCYLLTIQFTSHTHMHTRAYTNTAVGHFISPSSVLCLSSLFPSLINIAKPLNSPKSFFSSYSRTIRAAKGTSI